MTDSHKQVRIRANGKSASVDEGMVSIIRAFWKLDIATISSCQGGGDEWPYIEFTPTGVTKFLMTMPELPKGGPENPVLHALGGGDDRPNQAWKWSVFPVWGEKMTCPMLWTLVKMPPADLAWLDTELNKLTA